MQEINLYKLLFHYAKNWVFIVVLTALGLVGGVIYNDFIQTPLYKSQATLLLVSSTGNATQDTTQINNYVALFTSRRVLEPVISDQNLDVSYAGIAQSTTAVNKKGTQVIDVSVSTNDPEVSQHFIEGAVKSFKRQVAALYGRDNVKVVDNASNATPAFNVNKNTQLALAAAIGFVASSIVLFFVYDFNLSNKSGSRKMNKRVDTYPTLRNMGVILTGRVGIAQTFKKKAVRKATKKTSVKPASAKTGKAVKASNAKAAKPVAAKKARAATAVKKKTTKASPKKAMKTDVSNDTL